MPVNKTGTPLLADCGVVVVEWSSWSGLREVAVVERSSSSGRVLSVAQEAPSNLKVAFFPLHFQTTTPSSPPPPTRPHTFPAGTCAWASSLSIALRSICSILSFHLHPRNNRRPLTMPSPLLPQKFSVCWVLILGRRIVKRNVKPSLQDCSPPDVPPHQRRMHVVQIGRHLSWRPIHFPPCDSSWRNTFLAVFQMYENIVFHVQERTTKYQIPAPIRS